MQPIFSRVFQKRLQAEIAGEVVSHLAARILYSTDASIYQIEPLGVVFPRTLDDLDSVVGLCAQEGVPLLARGAGSSLGGQAIGRALIIDCARYLNRLEQLDVVKREAWVQPGLVLAELNRQAGRVGLQFGPDPASAERATLGGCLGNNATGAHSITYGMAVDHLLEADVLLGDGSRVTFTEIALEEAKKIAHSHKYIRDAIQKSVRQTCEANLYAAALQVRQGAEREIQRRWPKTWRRASGYNLNYLLPWAESQPPNWQQYASANGVVETYPPVAAGKINLAQLFAGAEGTLGVIRRARLRLVPLPEQTVLAVLSFDSIQAACDATPAILRRSPSAVELIPGSLISLARSLPAYASQLRFLEGLALNGQAPQAVLAVEFCGADRLELVQQAKALQDFAPLLVAENAREQKQVWGVRKVGLGILMSQAGDRKPWAFIEDLSVPVENLGALLRGMDEILAAHHTTCEIYGHASAGCVHIRPLLNLKTLQGRKDLRTIAFQACELAVRLGGSVSGEHGDGIARLESSQRMFGPNLVQAFRQVKQAADPQGIFNPGKVVDLDPFAAPHPVDRDLRTSGGEKTAPWQTALDFSAQGGLDGAIEQCNGAGVCRKAGGVMCPSFQVTQDEANSTRGRANLLRALISGRLGENLQRRLADFEAAGAPGRGAKRGQSGSPGAIAAELAPLVDAMDLCLACKGCKAECPSAVDMAKLRYEFVHWLHRSDGGAQSRRLRDYLFGFFGDLARFGQPFGGLINLLAETPLAAPVKRALGLAPQRPLPKFAGKTLAQIARKDFLQLERGRGISANRAPVRKHTDVADELDDGLREPVLFLSDAFCENFYPQAGNAALQALALAGCHSLYLRTCGAGRTLISKGFLDQARAHAVRLVAEIKLHDPQGRIPLVGVEPSEIYTVCDEYLDFFPGDGYVRDLSQRVFTIEEYLLRPSGVFVQNNKLRIAIIQQKELFKTMLFPKYKKVLLHAHCYQRARGPAADGFASGERSTVEFLQALGYQVELVDDGCCGMAGAFGYEAEHYQLSKQVGELALLPAVRQAGPEVLIATSGVSCKAQIEDFAGRQALHPIELLFPAGFPVNHG